MTPSPGAPHNQGAVREQHGNLDEGILVFDVKMNYLSYLK
jgi:hypothetical protein